MLDNSSPPSLDSSGKPKNGKALTKWSQKKQKIFYAIKDWNQGARFICCEWSDWQPREEAAKELSGGEQQHVAVALALSNGRSLILADKRTGNLDRGTRKRLPGCFLSLAEKYGKRVIMASHDPKAMEHFKKVYNMRDGNFV